MSDEEYDPLASAIEEAWLAEKRSEEALENYDRTSEQGPPDDDRDDQDPEVEDDEES